MSKNSQYLIAFNMETNPSMPCHEVSVYFLMVYQNQLAWYPSFNSSTLTISHLMFGFSYRRDSGIKTKYRIYMHGTGVYST